MIRIGVSSLQSKRRDFHRPSSHFRRPKETVANLSPLSIPRHGAAIGLRLAHSIIIVLNLSNIGEIECCSSILQRCHKVIPMALRRPRFLPRTICQSLGLLASIWWILWLRRWDKYQGQRRIIKTRSCKAWSLVKIWCNPRLHHGTYEYLVLWSP